MKTSLHIALTLNALAIVSTTSGCGPATATVSGAVTLDDKPVSSGVISVVSADGVAAPATANIASGKYELQTTAGKKFVQISAPVVVGKRKEYEGPDAPLVEITEESVPARYNSQTELQFELKRGRNTKDWNVTSQPKTR